ncbi:type VII secretion-associated serine protease mycosin [Streptomyces sp. ISL-100]|uniref:type VII secretion-associated serine protease mycosin n=1 Tax=Streptomyces sp. ISL-100 TaxID=2819173 RepID=UPI001BE57560|nr:type VII secretion-associated serine protease mycosin [Streptomyces sp. ISL-100]MBT2395194.1 type VII secretion-associated serine protease mycosin [Streptomyces sp. ISL-100]
MGVKRVWSTAGVVALTGALLLTSAPVASADYIRDQQWTLGVFSSEKVWAESQGQGVTVAVVDTGVDASHPDVTGQVLAGKDFTGDEDPHSDEGGHGTGMASLIAGHGHGENNSAGVMGLAPKAKILPVRVMRTGKGDVIDERRWAAGIRYAVDQGASVINLSFIDEHAYPGTDAAKAIAYAQERDVVVVAGAGNDGEAKVSTPAALPGVVAVGAVDRSLDFWDKSNFGKGMTLTAPGEKNLTADPTRSGGYAETAGTSDSTAFVSATAALVRSKYPDLTAGQVINRLIKSATLLKHDVKKVPDEEFGYGILRPYQALTMNIPKGPKEGPLAKAPSSTSSKAGSASESDDSTTSQAKKRKKTSSGGILVIAGIAAVVVIGGIVFALIRSRSNRGSGGPGGTYPQGMGYPNQPPYPAAQQPHTTAAPGQAQTSSPYGQQPPPHGQ